MNTCYGEVKNNNLFTQVEAESIQSEIEGGSLKK